jgi:hypothetical protein
MSDKPKPPSYRKILAPCFPADESQGITEAVKEMSMADYRRAPGFAPSDIKIASEEIGPRKWRGHLTRVANDRLARWHEANDVDLPPGLQGSTKASADMQVGSVYHSLLLTPERFDAEYAILTPEILEGLKAERRERKSADGPSKYSGRLAEAQAFKEEHGRLPETDEEKAAVMAEVAKRFDGDETFPQKEHERWVSEQVEAGREVIPASVKHHAECMIDALYRERENTEVGEYIKSLNLSPDRNEVSLFAVARLGNRDDSPLIQLKGRPDVIPHGEDLIDPKTAICVHPDAFTYAVETYNYDLSMAGYSLLSDLLAGHESCEGFGFPKRRFGFLSQEKTPPYLARIHWLPEDWVEAMKRRYKTELMKIANLYRSGKWSGDLMAPQIGTLMPSPWKEKEIEMYL